VWGGSSVVDECGNCGGSGIPEGACNCDGDLPAANYDCDGNCLNDSDGDGLCDEEEVPGCVVPGACNYVALPTELVACVYPDAGYDCDGNCLGDADGDGVCDANEVVGCQDSAACNYDSSATDAGDCDYSSCLGCTDASACNYDASSTQEDGSCDYCSCDNAGGGQDGFGLELELVSNNGINNTYRVYVTTPGADDFVSSVSGDVTNPSYLRTTTSFYQSPMGGLTGDLVNPLFFPMFPELALDSWITIGVDQSPQAGEGTVSTAIAGGDTWATDFEAGDNLELNSFFGGSWFSLNNVSNGFAGDDNRVLVAQLTTDGNITGSLYTQIFPNGDSSEQLLLNLSFGTLGCGCTDASACNYDADAYYDDGSCSVADDCGVCGGDNTSCADCAGVANGDSTTDECGTCDNDASNDCVQDCAGTWGGSSVLDECGVCGGSGIPAGDCDCDGNVLDECGVCGGDGIPEGDCDCDGNTPDLTEVPGEGGSSCGLFFSGYAEGSSNNKFLEIYNPTGSDISLDGFAFPSVSNAPTTPGEHEYWNTFPEGAVIAAGDVYVIAHGSADPAILAEADAFHTYLSNGDDGYALVEGDESGYVIVDMIGTWDADPGSGWEVAGVANGTKDHSLIRKSDVNSGNGGDWATSAGTDADDSEWIVLDQNDWTGLGAHDFTGSCSGANLVLVYDCDGACLNDSDGDGVCDELEVAGCTDSGACNYDSSATDDDGSCDFVSCAGCTDDGACNYDADAILEDGSCTYAADFQDCDGNCLNDANGNGICDEVEVDGCTYPDACNYDAGANVEDMSCDFSCLSGPCDDNCPGDLNGDLEVDVSDLLDFFQLWGNVCE
jgi:hypothetical protein